jgi:chromosomal replication initiation ATPase DnaA
MTRIPPMIVCPYCGPTHVMYAGRIISRVCADCERDLAPAVTPERMAEWGKDLAGGYAEKLAARDAEIARLTKALANADENAECLADVGSRAHDSNRALRAALADAEAALTQAADALDNKVGYMQTRGMDTFLETKNANAARAAAAKARQEPERAKQARGV